MAKQIVTLYIEDAGLCLLVTRGKHIKKWVQLPFEPGLVKGGVVIKELEVARRIKEVFKAQKVNAKKVVVGVSGLHSLTRPLTFSAVPKVKLAEVILSEARKNLPVQLDQFYVSWKTAPRPDGKLQVFVAALPRRTVDSVLGALTQAGLRSYRLDLKPLALARLVREPTAVIVDVQQTEFDIVVMANGIPQPIRTVPLAEGFLAEKLSTIENDVRRTVEFYNSNNPDKPLDSNVPLYVSGELAAEPEMSKIFSERLEHPLSVLVSPLHSRELAEMGPYLVNIGLVLNELSSVRAATYPPANVNVLPDAYREKPPSFTRSVVAPLFAGGMAVIILVLVMLQSASANIVSMRDQLSMANLSMGLRQAEEQQLKKDIVALEKKAAKVAATYASLVKVLNNFKVVNDRFNGDFQTIKESLYFDMKLGNLRYEKNRLIIKGWVPKQKDVLDFATRLENTGRFPEVIVASMMKVQDQERVEGVEFTLELKGW